LKQSTIIRQVNRDIDDSYANQDIIDWLNRCSDDLTPAAKKEKKTSFTIDSTNSYTLPIDLHRVAYVMVGDERYEPIQVTDKASKGFTLWEGKLSLQNGPDSGTIDLYYYKKLNKLNNPEDEPEIDEEFHDLYILYAVGQLQFTEEEYDDRPDAMMRYEQRKREFSAHINRKHRLNKVRVVW
jgi:hypothetical protein